jgi:hypothetical protein
MPIVLSSYFETTAAKLGCWVPRGSPFAMKPSTENTILWIAIWLAMSGLYLMMLLLL